MASEIAVNKGCSYFFTLSNPVSQLLKKLIVVLSD